VKFRIIETENLFESRLTDVKQKYPEVDEKTIEEFSKNDPSKNNKYLSWMVDQFNNGNSKLDIIKRVKYFHKHLNSFKNKDIFKYSFDDLKDEIDNVENKKQEKEVKVLKQKDVDIILNDENYLIVYPKSYEASVKYGKGTKWCTASKETDIHWKDYNKKGFFYYLLDKRKSSNDPNYKLAFYYKIINSNFKIWDAKDELILDDNNLNNLNIDEYVKKIMIKNIKKFVDKFKITPEFYGIKDYRFNLDGTLDVFQNVYLNYHLYKLPFKFGKIDGDFFCDNNKLTNLKGCPKIVNGDFTCGGNRLTSLKGSPEEVNGYFSCNTNKLTSLKYLPKIINGHLDCRHNDLTSLKYCTKNINGYFDCSENRKLKSLKYAPEKVNGWFSCVDTDLESLRYAPKIVTGNFYCDNVYKLKSLEGLNLDGMGGKIYARHNPNLKLTEKEKLWTTLNHGRLSLRLGKFY